MSSTPPRSEPGVGAPTVWIFGDLPLGTPCGPSYMVESWARELRRQGWRTRLFTPSGSLAKARTAEAVTFRTLRNVGFHGDHNARFSALREHRLARRRLPDVILSTTPGRVGALGVSIAGRFRLPLVMVESTDITGAARHYNPFRVLFSGGMAPLIVAASSQRVRRALTRRVRHSHRLLNRAALAEVFCEAMRADAGEVILLSPKMAALPSMLPPVGADAGGGAPRIVVPAGIDRLPQCPLPAAVHWRPSALRVLFVGRLQPEKNPHLLVDAAARATRAGVDLHLMLVGGGQLAGALREHAARAGIADRVTVTGPFPRPELGGVYASADVFAFPSVVETQAFVLNEAAHEGLPLLVSDRDVNPVVSDGESAIVVMPEPQAYADALARLADPVLRARLGTAAQRLARTNTEPAQAALLAQSLQRVLSGTTGAVVPRPSIRPARARISQRAKVEAGQR